MTSESTPAQIVALHALADDYFRISNDHDVDALVALHAPHYVSHEANGETADLADFREQIDGFFQAFPDAKLTPINVVAEGDLLVVHFETTGTHTGPGMGMTPTGKPIQFSEIRVRRVVDGKIAEHWGLYDTAAFMGQLQS